MSADISEHSKIHHFDRWWRFFWVTSLGTLIVLGLFFRFFQHHDLLRFNADQARDASVVNGVINEGQTLPLLGPKAGGTQFKLGPAFYYFQIASAKLFGMEPDVLAYPDLFFSILSIPIFYALLRVYFKMPIALSLTGLFSLSAFAIKYARFAWNPNPIPFFTMLWLYALLRLADASSKRTATGWAMLAGIGLGIGIQLHTLLLIVMPIVSALFLWHLASIKKPIVSLLMTIFLTTLVLNIPQVIHEAQTNGENIKAFFGGISTKSKKDVSVLGNILSDAVCQMQANSHILSATGSDSTCGTGDLAKAFTKTSGTLSAFLFAGGQIASFLLTFGGVILYIRAYRQERIASKKRFLLILGEFTLTYFLLLIPLASEISLRFYLPLIFVPFLLLGLWYEYALTLKYHLKHTFVAIGIALSVANGIAVRATSDAYSGKTGETSTTTEAITLGETESLAKAIVSHASGNATVFITGQQVYLFKYLRSIEYFTKQSGVALNQKSKKQELPENAILVYLGDNGQSEKLPASLEHSFIVTTVERHGRFSLSLLQKN